MTDSLRCVQGFFGDGEFHFWPCDPGPQNKVEGVARTDLGGQPDLPWSTKSCRELFVVEGGKQCKWTPLKCCCNVDPSEAVKRARTLGVVREETKINHFLVGWQFVIASRWWTPSRSCQTYTNIQSYSVFVKSEITHFWVGSILTKTESFKKSLWKLSNIHDNVERNIIELKLPNIFMTDFLESTCQT